jgi:hypothetical protein
VDQLVALKLEYKEKSGKDYGAAPPKEKKEGKEKKEKAEAAGAPKVAAPVVRTNFQVLFNVLFCFVLL